MQAKIITPRAMVWLSAALLSTAALSQPVQAGGNAALQRFMDCSKIGDNTERLTCFDETAKSIAEANKPKPPKSPEEAKQAVEESFGHEALPTELRHDEKKADEYRAKVAAFSADAYGNLVLVLENGQVWQQTDGLQTQLFTGEQWVTIHRAVMGSYLITIESAHRTYRFKRLK